MDEADASQSEGISAVVGSSPSGPRPVRRRAEWQVGRWLYLAIFIIWDLYLYGAMLAPYKPVPGFELADINIALLRLSVALPYLITWLAGAYAYLKLKRYVKTIGGTPEGRAFNKMAVGLIILVGGLIAGVLVGLIRSYFVGTNLNAPLTILANYLYVFPHLAAFAMLYNGTRLLFSQTHDQKLGVSFSRRSLIYVVPLGLFTYYWLDLIFTNTARLVSPGPGLGASYYLNDSLIVLTIVVPLLLTWVLGLQAVLDLTSYNRRISGVIYRRALVFLVTGMFAVILGSILIQALLSLGPNRLLQLGLGKLLGAIYLFILFQLGGFGLIARGAKRLTKIETV